MEEQWTGIFVDFPQDDLYWRIDWFGDVAHGINTPTEPKISVMLSPLNIDALEKNELWYINIIDHLRQKVVYINVGYLPYIYIGAFFKNGRLSIEPRFQKYKIETQTLDLTNGETARLIPANFKIQDNEGNADFIIPSKGHRLGMIGLSTKLFAIDDNNTKYKYLIPSIEIGRYFYFNSTKLIRQLFWGGLKGNNTIYNPSKSYLADDGRGFLCLREGIDDADCWVVSQFAFNKNTFNRATQIHTSNVKNKLKNIPLNPEIIPPIDGVFTLKMQGKWIKSTGEWRFLVFRILNSNYSFPTDNLHVDRDNNGINNGTHDKNRTIYDRNSHNKNFKKSKQTESPELITTDEPNKDTSTVLSLLHDSRFESLKGKQYIKITPEEHTHRANPENPSHILSAVDTVATGDGMHNKTDIAPLNIQTNQDNDTQIQNKREKLPSADLDRFELVLMNLSLFDVTYKFIALDSLDISDDKYCNFPSHSTHRPSWLLNVHNNPRRLLLAEITFLNSTFYLFEAEAQQEDKKGKRKNLTTLLLHSDKYSIINQNILSKIITSAIKNKGVWDKVHVSNNLCYLKLKHSWRLPSNFAQTLLDKFKSHINQSSDKCMFCHQIDTDKNVAKLLPQYISSKN